MKRILLNRLTRFIPLAVALGFVGDPSESSAEVKAATKSKRSSSAIVRAQNSDIASVKTTSASTDEEIFDRDLSPVSGQVDNSCVPNCTTIFDPQLGSPGVNSPMPLDSQQTPNSNSGLSDPNSVFSQQPQQSQLPAPVSSLAAGQGASTAMNQVPAFMGDFFSGPGTIISNSPSSFPSPVSGTVSIPSQTGVGVMKLAENTSPLPRDRVFLSYNYFDNVNLIPGGMAVNRLTPGVEKTFFGGNASVEVRVPMALTLASTTSLDKNGVAGYDTSQYQFGNVTTYFKGLLYRDNVFALSAGLGVAAPTANDTRIQNSSGNTVALISNQAWHVMPFLGSVITPNDRWFAQTMLQFDFATNGNSVFTPQDGFTPSSLARYGALNDPAYLFASIGTGYWMYQSADPSARLSKISLISEFHFNTSLQSTNTVVGPVLTAGSYQSQIQTQNAVFGTNIMFDQNKSLMLGYVVPIGGGADQAFSGEFRVLFNWYFGPYQNRASRVQF